MKKYAPFVVTGLLSAGLALGLFSLINKPDTGLELSIPQTVLTNYSPSWIGIPVLLAGWNA
jgi:hypothetical protein